MLHAIALLFQVAMAPQHIHNIGLSDDIHPENNRKAFNTPRRHIRPPTPVTNPQTPLEIFNDLYYVKVLLFQKLVGVNYITNPDFRPIRLTWFWICIIIIFFVSFVYTLVVYDKFTKWKSLCLVGLGIQGIAKYIFLITNAATIYKRIHFLESVYSRNVRTTQRAYAILQRFAVAASVIVKVSTVIILGSLIGFFMTAAIVSVVEGTRMPLFEAYLPFLDESTNVGFAVLGVFHGLGIFLAGSGTCSTDIMFILFVVHMKPLVDIFNDHLRQMDEHVAECNYESSVRMERFLQNIVKMHIDICS